jgi:hypothetical protein
MSSVQPATVDRASALHSSGSVMTTSCTKYGA